MSDEAKQKMRDAKIKNPTRFWLGKKRGALSQETKNAISATLKGRKLPPEHIQHMLESRAKNKQLKSQQNNVQPAILPVQETNFTAKESESNPEVLTGHDDIRPAN